MAWMRAVAQTRKRTVSARSQGSCAPSLSRVGSAGAAWDPRDGAEPKCDSAARRSCVGSSGKWARVQRCPAATLPSSSLCAGKSVPPPAPCFVPPVKLADKTWDPRIQGSREESVPRTICFLSSLPPCVCTHSPRRQNPDLFRPAGDSDASSVAGMPAHGSGALLSRLVAVNSALQLGIFVQTGPSLSSPVTEESCSV